MVSQADKSAPKPEKHFVSAFMHLKRRISFEMRSDGTFIFDLKGSNSALRSPLSPPLFLRFHFQQVDAAEPDSVMVVTAPSSESSSRTLLIFLRDLY